MNAVVIAIAVMFILSLARVSVVLTLVISAIIGGLVAGLSLSQTVEAFNAGLGDGAEVALAYAVLGAFALALSKSGLPDLLAHKLIGLLGFEASKNQEKKVKYLLLTILLIAAIFSQNLIPVHIAFIPVLVPPLLKVMNHLKLDRRAAACVLTLGLVGTYIFLPVGFGAIFLEQILMGNINKIGAAYGLHVERSMMPIGMAIPVLGMVLGTLVAVFVSYRKPREYVDRTITTVKTIDLDKPLRTTSQVEHDLKADAEELRHEAENVPTISKKTMFMALLAIVLTLVAQLYSGSMILGGLVGFAVLSASGIFKWQDADDVFVQGMRMMALVGFIMISAAGFASVMTHTGDINQLVNGVVNIIGDNHALAAFLMLFIGLFVTIGIGSSFSSVPVLAVIYVPLCVQFGFSPLATIALIGTAAALGDAGSPASDSTLGPTAGLGVDGQHDHIWDTVVPTFIHFNIPLLIFGWIAAMIL
ncbi:MULTISPECIES: Na+/H+ antiporter family protein [Acinetobacter]|uniref:Na+/H+ antiporter family protein n=2 Tax=Acinetobacter junii TaxID=40215 RepID=A0A365PF73_ACIJU|nr:MULTISPECIES: Na+/H+ antiporter family protein [Acinetobacter]EPR81926.1 Histidine permease YuiF [Acinetobacter junii CIP 107470 = MTCC 11364]MBJ8441503.1 Na+/H+ antiporter family protein [Acinetobacter junii]MCU4396658.1 Na+/H+ antiporter family protein [Acinetobacter junii]MDH1374973.1 Na+/H+ antiporter family protein [Acinetobacter junii]MDH1914724.1 Na+/H+ antiporter family protein [Acinetobacter junii]